MLTLDKNRRMLRPGLVLIAAVLLVPGCTLDTTDTPEPTGPSELGTAIEMRALPDQLVADGFSSSIIEAVVRGPNGERVQGREIIFDISQFTVVDVVDIPTGTFLDLGNLAPVNGPRPTFGGVESGPVSAFSDGDGVARARYWAPFRTDQENDMTVTITGRPAFTDFNAARLRNTTIFLRAANRPSFPGGTTCGFIWEPDKLTYRVGEGIAFTATQLTGAAGNPIARYEWIFDSEDEAEGRTPVHAFSTPGTKTIILITHESITGARETCSETLDIVP